MNLTVYGQRDPRWADVKLGSEGLLDIFHYGCTTVALCMLNNKLGADCLPTDVAAHLGWYTPQGLILWNKLDLHCATLDLNGRDYGFDEQRIRGAIKDPNRGCIIEVQIPRGGKHWLFGHSISLFGKILAADPWSNSVVDLVQKYGRPTGAAFFSKRLN